MTISDIMAVSQVAMQYEVQHSSLIAKQVAIANSPIPHGQSVKLNQLDVAMFQNLLLSGEPLAASTVNFQRAEAELPMRKAHEPDSPYADENGMVQYLELDLAKAFVELSLSKRAYEAHIKVFNNASKMSAAALKIGG